MASKKKDPAALRTIGLFTGRTPLEEAELTLLEEPEDVKESREAGERDIVAEAEEGAIRWLGLDVFREGDDIKVAVHPRGHAVVVLVHADSKGGARATTQFKLSAAQWKKLRALAKEA